MGAKSRPSATTVHLIATTGRAHGGSHCTGILRYTSGLPANSMKQSFKDAPDEVKI